MQENDSVEKSSGDVAAARPLRKRRVENKRPLWADYEPMAHRGLYLGTGPGVRGRYFVLRGGQMHPLVSAVNSPGMFRELRESDPDIIAGTVPPDVRSALLKCWRRCVERDKGRRMVTTITVDDLVEVYLRQKGKCALTGMPFVLPDNRDDQERRGPWSPSVDRLNNRNGYTVENIQLVTVMANGAKSDFTAKEFHRMCAHAAMNMKLLGPKE